MRDGDPDEYDFNACDIFDSLIDRWNDSRSSRDAFCVACASAEIDKAIADWNARFPASIREPYQIHFTLLEDLHRTLYPFDEIHHQVSWTTINVVRRELLHFFAESRVYGPLSFEAFNEVDTISASAAARFKSVSRAIDALRNTATGEHFANSKDVALPNVASLKRKVADYREIEQSYRAYMRLVEATRKRWQRFASAVRMGSASAIYRPVLSELDRLALNPEQEQLVKLSHTGPFRMQGTAGSGKTLVLLHRAISLAMANRDKQIGLFTVSKALADHLAQTFETLAGWTPPNVTISSFYDYWQRRMELFDRRITQRLRLNDPISGERVARQTWSDFRFHRGTSPRANIFTDLDVVAMVQFVSENTDDESEFLRQEMTYILSGYPVDRRNDYLTDHRRSRPLRLIPRYKQACLRIATRWEEYMQAGALSDIEGLMLEGLKATEGQFVAAGNALRPEFHHVLVDEYQDFSTVELVLLQRMCVDPEGSDSLFLVGDLQQKVLPKHHHTTRAGLNFQRRSAHLRSNYRNTQEILRAALNLPKIYPPQEDQDDEQIEIQRPELSPFSGGRPLMVAASRYDTYSFVSDIVRERKHSRVGILSHNREVLDKVELALGVTHGDHRIIRIQSNDELDAWREHNVSTRRGVFISEYSVAKGFEFDTVVILDLSRDSFPPQGMQANYLWKEAAKLYVALTRARDELVILYTGQPSDFLDVMRDDVEYVDNLDSHGLVSHLLREEKRRT
jgi:hypothetical protein